MSLVKKLFFMSLALASVLAAHGVTGGDKGYIQEITGINAVPFMYLGAKHMVTGYDHLLFLFGVIFFLYKLKDVALYVSLFALGHSVTLISGVYFDIRANAYIIDAIIGLSVVYKAFDNLGYYKKWFGFSPDLRAATFSFGLFHGFGLAVKIQEFELSPQGLLTNLISFNVGVEIGQIIALSLMLILLGIWRQSGTFNAWSKGTNIVLSLCGFALFFYQMNGYFAN